MNNMSLSATSTSRLRRQQRLQQSRTPTKQRQHKHQQQSYNQQQQYRQDHRRSQSEVVPVAANFFHDEPVLTSMSHLGGSPSPNAVVTPNSDSPPDSRNLDRSSISLLELSSPVQLQFTDGSSPSSRQIPRSPSFRRNDEMPMDEMMDTLKVGGRPASSSGSDLETTPPSKTKPASVRRQYLGPSVLDTDERSSSAHLSSDEVSFSTEEQAPLAASLKRITKAIKNRERPSNCTKEERALFDVVQKTMGAARAEHRHLEQQFQELANKHEKLRQRERKIHKRLEAMKDGNQGGKTASALHNSREQMDFEEQEENDRAFRAIQRVLADVTTERDTVVEKLTNDLQNSIQNSEAIAQQMNDVKQARDRLSGENIQLRLELENLKKTLPPVINATVDVQNGWGDTTNVLELKQMLAQAEEEKNALKRDLEVQHSRMISAEKELQLSKVTLKKREEEENQDNSQLTEETTQLVSELEEAKKEIESLKAKKRELFVEVETKTKLLKDDRGENGASELADEILSLQKQLEEKSTSLENAKMIIASLENANGSLAVDHRAKLKDKEEELVSVQKTAADRKRMLDNLATELRELQKKQGNIDVVERRNKTLWTRHRKLANLLERNVKSLRNAAVMHEAMGDANSVDMVSAIVSETFTALKASVESSEELLRSAVDSGERDCNQKDVACQAGEENDGENAKNLMLQLASKTTAVVELEEALEDMRRSKSAAEQKKMECEEECNKLRLEIEDLKGQCKTNMEVLAKKGRELEVLRDSLKVEDAVGYISDDGSESDALTQVENLSSTSKVYGPSQAEAIATLLSHSGNGIEVGIQSLASEEELNTLRVELGKAQREVDDKEKLLKSERESLANAKMIISSLEKANKSMMEDLRSRLQDSNTAIASLLEKSMQQEQTSANLRAEVDRLKTGREEDQKRKKIEVAQLQEENLVITMQLEGKDREIEELRSALSEAPQVSPSPVGSVEEKKEEAAFSQNG